MSILVSTLLSYVETKTQAGTGTLNAVSPGVNFLNEAMLQFRGLLIQRGIDAAQLQESYADGASTTSGGITYSTFAFPSDMFALKTIEVNMTDSSQDNYVQAQSIDIANTPGNTSADFLRKNQPAGQPLFDNRGDTYEIFPNFSVGSNTTKAIRLQYYLQPTLYATTADTLTYPDTLDWYILAERVSALYFESLTKFDEADKWHEKADKRTMLITESLAPGSKVPVQTQGLSLTGFEF